MLLQPDGQEVIMSRVQSNPNLIEGMGWAGTLKSDSIELSAECGWKASYTGGKISLLVSPKDDHLVYKYTDGVLSEVSVNGIGTIFVKFEQSTRSTSIMGMDNEVRCESTTYPQYSLLKGVPVVTEVSTTVGKLSNDKCSFEFVYRLNDDRTMGMTTNYEDEKHDYRWEIDSGKVSKVDGWSYLAHLEEYAHLGYNVERFHDGDRQHSDLVSWDPQTGIKRQRINGGEMITTTCYVTGLAAGKIKRISSSGRLGDRDLATFFYDSKGRAIGSKDLSGRYLVTTGTAKTFTWLNNSGHKLVGTYDAHDQLTSLEIDGVSFAVAGISRTEVLLKRTSDALAVYLPKESLRGLYSLTAIRTEEPTN